MVQELQLNLGKWENLHWILRENNKV